MRSVRILHLSFVLLYCQGTLRPFLIDPSSRATEWLKNHLKDKRLEVINQQVCVTVYRQVVLTRFDFPLDEEVCPMSCLKLFEVYC
jgi:hypothetical protein